MARRCHLDLLDGDYWRRIYVVVPIDATDMATGETRELVRTLNAGQYAYPYNLSCVGWRPMKEDHS